MEVLYQELLPLHLYKINQSLLICSADCIPILLADPVNSIVSAIHAGWKGLAKNDGMEMGDIITEFKIENLDRPSKAIVYPFAFLFLFGFGYLNYKRKT